MLRRYYKDLENKTAFINEVCFKTGRSAATVHNWIKYGMKPHNPKDIEVLSAITGIAAKDLWNDENR